MSRTEQIINQLIMTKKIYLSIAAALVCALCSAQIPSLQKVGNKTCLMVDGKPYVMLSGELHNSTASSISYMEQEKTFENLKNLGLNTVIATVSWEQFEPQEGKYDFTLTDYLLNTARKNDLHLVMLWFGTFKNPFMTYAPSWVKRDPKRFPKAVDQSGNDMEMLTLFDENIAKAETKAYAAFMKYLKEKDPQHTVLMIQIENEPGLRGTPRDFSKAAEKAWKDNVPKSVINYLKKNADTLQPDLKQAWEENGSKTKGSWEQVFGKSVTVRDESDKIVNLTEHLFTAYEYAQFLETITKAGKAVYNLPHFINASVFGLNSRGNSLGNGCSIPEFFDIYRAAAPSIDVLTPNSYMQQLDGICKVFSWNGTNPILIPESGVQGARALYTVGEWHCLGFSPFAIDDAGKDYATANPTTVNKQMAQSYKEMTQMGDLLINALGTDKMRGAYIYAGHEGEILQMGDYQITITPRKGYDIGFMMGAGIEAGQQGNAATGRRAEAGAPAPTAGGFGGGRGANNAPVQPGGVLILQASADEFYLVGYGYNADFAIAPGIKSKYCSTDYIYEGHFENGKFVEGRLLNGDERNIYVADDSFNVLKVKMYHY